MVGMAKALHVFDFLAAPAEHPPAGVCVLFGDEPFLRQLARRQIRQAVLDSTADDVPFAEFDGRTAEWRDVVDELATVALFGPGRRLAQVDEGDDFIKKYRDKLEDYAAKPARNSVLVIDATTFPGNTRLYKAVEKSGLAIHCAAPEKSGGKRKAIDLAQLGRWLIQWSRDQHDCKLERTAADLLLELVGPDVGLLDQSLAKLALFAGKGGKVTPEMVRDVIGGWRTQTIWELLDAATEGDAAAALLQLDHLVQAGESPIALFGQISWSLRRFAATTRIFQHGMRVGRRPGIAEALQQAGFHQWPQGALAKAESQLKQLTRHRAGKLYRWLLDADLALKGSHSQDARARLVLEMLIVHMARQRGPHAAG